MTTSGTTPRRAALPRAARLERAVGAATEALGLVGLTAAGGALLAAFLITPAPPAPVVPISTVSAPRSDLEANAGAPTKLVMPALKISAPVVPITMVDSALDPPRDHLEVGWWISSAKPGAEEGQTVITGHTVHTGGASMNNLGMLQVADEVDVTTKHGVMTYRVTGSEVLTKKQLARRSTELFGQDRGDGRLVLITCSNWNGESYDTNTVVYAEPLGLAVKGQTKGS